MHTIAIHPDGPTNKRKKDTTITKTKSNQGTWKKITIIIQFDYYFDKYAHIRAVYQWRLGKYIHIFLSFCPKRLKCIYFPKRYICTLYCISLRRCCFGMETRVIIQILTHPCYPINVDWFSLGWSKKIKIADSKKTEIFNSPNAQ